VLCFIGRHRAVDAPAPIWNDGLYFSHCARCGAELIRPAVGAWQTVPKGKLIVWKPRTEWDLDWNQMEGQALSWPLTPGVETR